MKGEAEVIGSDTSSQLMYRRGSFVVLQTEKLSYRLLKSEGDSATTLVTAQAPRSIIERSIGTPSLDAHIVVDKFDRGMPLYRQEEEFGQLDARIDRGTMSRWLEELGGTVGATVLEAIRTDAFATAMCDVSPPVNRSTTSRQREVGPVHHRSERRGMLGQGARRPA